MHVFVFIYTLMYTVYTHVNKNLFWIRLIMINPFDSTIHTHTYIYIYIYIYI